MSFPQLDVETKELYDKLCEIGCCKLCILRFIGETERSAFVDYRKTFKTRGINVEENENHKIQKPNSCVTCLGLLEPNVVDDTVRKICSEINKAGYDSKTYIAALTVPVSLMLRSRALWIYLKKGFPNVCKTFFPLELVTITQKDVWKWISQPYISMALLKSFSNSSDFVININFNYDDDSEEKCITEMGYIPPGKRLKKVVYSRKGVEEFLNKISDETFCQHYNVPPKIPSQSIYCASISLLQNPIIFAGRYNKFLRGLPQTPWVIDGERRVENSIHEIIAEPIVEYTKAETSRFSASGREDVDVRTLGAGRPFAVELIDPKRSILTFDCIRELERQINESGHGKVAVRDLQLVDKDGLKPLKEGEESKRKGYMAYCIAFGPLPDDVDKLSSLTPLKLMQKTPIRVLHRRPYACRPREIYSIQITPHVTTSDPNGRSFFKLYVETQAGTYVKEFVHGDFGRTQPSLRDLLGGVNCDILALDVVEVFIDWPPKVVNSV